MAPKRTQENSPARAALERSLTLNKKQSWFGSIRNVVHQGALSAKAAVESLRDVDATSATPSDGAPESSRTSTDTSWSKSNTPVNMSVRHGASKNKTAVSSLRLHISRHSCSSSERASVSGIFRSGSNASLRGAQGPEVCCRHSQDYDKIVSPPSDSEAHRKQDASYIPLPSSPINIPSPPVPTLKLDFGPPDSLLPFPGITESQVADAKALQDPRNITTGAPTSRPYAWNIGNPTSSLFGQHRLDQEVQSPNAGSAKSSKEVERLGATPADRIDVEGAFGPGSPMPGTTLHLELHDARMDDSNSVTPNRIDEVSSKGHERLQHGEKDPFEVDTSETSAAILSENPIVLHPEAAEHRASKPIFGVLEMPPAEPRDDRSDGAPEQPHTLQCGQLHAIAPTSDGFQSTASQWDMLEKRPASGSGALAGRKDSLFDDGSMDTKLPNHGLPSPTRAVQLPLRLKTALTKHSSCGSMGFRSSIDRLATKRLSILKPGSDPTLRQKYFPQVTEELAALVQYPRQSSLDSDGTKTSQESDNSTSPDTSGIFERAVEQPSPLHIRKQIGVTTVPRPASPHTPKDATSPQTPGSDPFRTPSMGDRQLFDSQRAERNARYNAIHSGSYDTALDDDSNLHLANFGNAGPGSRKTTPGRNSSERELNLVGSPSRPEKGVAAWPPAQAAHGPRRSSLMALSRD